jgi:hypothetical protein
MERRRVADDLYVSAETSEASLAPERVALRLASLLEDADVPAVVSAESIQLAGAVFDCKPNPGEVIADIYDRLVASLLKQELVAVAKALLEQTVLPLRREPDLQVIEAPGGARVLAPDGPVADITGSRVFLLGSGQALATNGWPRMMTGNFLVVDAQWHYVTRCIRGLVRWQIRYARRQHEVVRALPLGVPPAQVSAMLDASARLRDERAVAYGHIVRLIGPDGLRIRIDPLWRDALHIELDFAITRGPQRLAGSLLIPNSAERRSSRLNQFGRRGATPHGTLSANDPSTGELMSLRIDGGDHDFVPHAWCIVLLAAADLLCVKYAASSLNAGDVRESERDGNPRTLAEGQRTTRLEHRRFGRRPPWLSERLTPTSETAKVLGHYVVGHVRRLPFGQASTDAHQNAAAVGMVIPDGFTWVKPHARGLPPGGALEFLWQPPASHQVDPMNWELG